MQDRQMETAAEAAAVVNQMVDQKKQRKELGQFVCLADRTRTKLPTPSEKQVLHNAGLGLKKISFDIDDDETDVYTKLMADAQNKENGETEGFPTLKHCGGFELLKCIPNCRILEPLNCKLNSISWLIGPILLKLV